MTEATQSGQGLQAELTPRRIRTVEFALGVTFFFQAVAALTSLPRIPEFIAQLHVSFTIWGAVIGFSGIGSLLPLIFTNRLINRYGAKRVLRISSVAIPAIIMSLPWTNNPWVFFILYFFQSLSFSTFNIALNSQAVNFQRRVGKILLGRFHGLWSMGAAMSAAVSGVMASFVPLRLHMFVIPAICAVAFQVANRYLLKIGEDGHLRDGGPAAKLPWLKSPKRLWFLALGLFAGMWPELVMMDWSTVYSKTILLTNATTGTLPYTVFVIAMIAGRFSLRRLSRDRHTSTVSKWGGYVGSFAMAGAFFGGAAFMHISPSLALAVTVAFLAIAGFGISSMVPSFYSVAGEIKQLNTAATLSRMSLANALMVMFAKYLMGAIAQNVNLVAAMVFPVATFFIAGVISSVVVKRFSKSQTAYPPTGPITTLDVE